MLVWSVLSKTSNFINILSQKYIFIFMTLLLLVYFDSSFIELSETFHIPENKAFLIGIFLIFVSLFIFINVVLIFTIKNVFLKNYSILGDKVKFIHNFIVIYLITISLLIIVLFSEMIIYNSYSIYLIYSLLIITHFTGIYFSVWGSIKFFNWFKSNNDKLLLVYAISFVTFIVLIALSLVYTLTELGHFTETILPSDLKRTIHVISVNLSEIYPFYRISFFLTFCSIWVLTAFLLYDYFGRNNQKKFWLVLSIPMLFFLIEFFPVTLKLLIGLYQLNPSIFLPFYTILSTIITFIGATMVSITLWLLIRKIPNKSFRNYLVLVTFGLLLVLTSTQETPFPRFLFPPFGLITILFVGLAIYLLFMGFYSASLHISKDMSLVRNFANRIHQYGFFRNIAKSQLEQDIKGIMTKALQSNELDIRQKEKEPRQELKKEDIEQLFQIVKRELEYKRSSNNNKK
jgi:hypothetical protein